MDIRGIIFDLDGTLYPMPRCVKFWMALALWRDLKLLTSINRSWDDIRSRHFDSPEALHRALYRALAQQAQCSQEYAATWYHENFLPAFVRFLARRAQPWPGLDELLRQSRNRGIKLAVLSDYPLVPERLDVLGIPRRHFDLMLGVEQAGALKPNPQAFLLCAEEFGISPEHCLVIGDRKDMEQAAAAAAGMPFWGIAESYKEPWYTWPVLKERLLGLASAVDYPLG